MQKSSISLAHKHEPFPLSCSHIRGKPPIITSTGGTIAPLSFVISPKCFISAPQNISSRSVSSSNGMSDDCL